MTPGPLQIALIVLVILLIFGAGRLPRLMEDLAKGIKSFKKGLKEEEAGAGADSNLNADNDAGTDTNTDTNARQNSVQSGPRQVEDRKE